MHLTDFNCYGGGNPQIGKNVMFDMTAYAQLRVLLSELEKIEDNLMPNELEMLHAIKAKYTDPQSPDPFDSTALNVILRNVDVRKDLNFDVKKDGGRVINLPSADDD